jgi:hypothetical protein
MYFHIECNSYFKHWKNHDYYKILWHADSLLGNDSEISDYTTAVTR